MLNMKRIVNINKRISKCMRSFEPLGVLLLPELYLSAVDYTFSTVASSESTSHTLNF